MIGASAALNIADARCAIFGRDCASKSPPLGNTGMHVSIKFGLPYLLCNEYLMMMRLF
jgi:hypothetical protein